MPWWQQLLKYKWITLWKSVARKKKPKKNGNSIRENHEAPKKTKSFLNLFSKYYKQSIACNIINQLLSTRLRVFSTMYFGWEPNEKPVPHFPSRLYPEIHQWTTGCNSTPKGNFSFHRNRTASIHSICCYARRSRWRGICCCCNLWPPQWGNKENAPFSHTIYFVLLLSAVTPAPAVIVAIKLLAENMNRQTDAYWMDIQSYVRRSICTPHMEVQWDDTE